MADTTERNIMLLFSRVESVVVVKIPRSIFNEASFSVRTSRVKCCVGASMEKYR